MLKQEVERLALENMAKIMHILGIYENVKINVVGNDDPAIGGHALGGYSNGLKEMRLNFDLLKTADDLLAVQCHEMIHCAQYMRGDLKDYSEGCIWKGKPYRHEIIHFANRSGIADAALPWETEAYGNMKAVAKQVRQLAGNL